MNVRTFGVLVAVALLPGCGSLYSEGQSPKPMGGIRTDADILFGKGGAWRSVRDGETAALAFGFTLVGAVDLPLCFAVDLVTLPYTIPAHCDAKRREEQRSKEPQWHAAKAPQEVFAAGVEFLNNEHTKIGIHVNASAAPGDDGDAYIDYDIPCVDTASPRPVLWHYGGARVATNHIPTKETLLVCRESLDALVLGDPVAENGSEGTIDWSTAKPRMLEEAVGSFILIVHADSAKLELYVPKAGTTRDGLVDHTRVDLVLATFR